TLLAFLAERAIPGVESARDGVYRRTISLDGEAGVLEVHPGGQDHLLLCAHLPFWEGLIHVVERVGRIFGVDADMAPAEAALADDPLIGPLIAARPGLRMPGAWGAFEIAVEAVLSQYDARARVREQLATVVEAAGRPVAGLDDGLTHLFPSARTLADTDLVTAGLPPTMARTLHDLAATAADDETLLDGGPGLVDFVAALAAIPGIEDSTAHRIALRLGHADAFPAADRSLRATLARNDIVEAADQLAARWQPWRAFAATHLIAAGTPTAA
ncbi:MAG: DNA-3-methyladenine glycosylase 2 family protein, partial [Kitasatospora sp.]|nr:DNA-3-methyladenine glycosylase 2 family protein [Kitasatospora sp.]